MARRYSTRMLGVATPRTGLDCFHGVHLTRLVDTIVSARASAFKMGWPDAYESRNEWAEERALADCANQVPAPGYVIVSANGDLCASALSILASRLGTRPQSEVREAFLRSIGRRWP